jgi:CRP/FNR family transcriptional regulator, cyclic AMP receptor protein
MATEPVRSTFDFLQWMDEDARLAYLATAKVRHFAAEQTIYLQGDPGFEMFRVKSGAVRLSVLSGDGRDVTYVRLGPGDCFGDVSMIDGEIRPQSAFAASDAAI